jgi:hypothetical protein
MHIYKYVQSHNIVLYKHVSVLFYDKNTIF